MNRGDELLMKLSGALTEPERGHLANELLTELFRGYPVDGLRSLLRSTKLDSIRTGVWLASELGNKGRTLLSDTSALLSHVDPRVRFDALDCILSTAGVGNGDILATALSLMSDSESSVRWKATDFAIRCSNEQMLEAAKALDRSADYDPALARGIRWLQTADATRGETIVANLAQENDIDRRIALIAAARISASLPGPLEVAGESDDPEIRKIAGQVLRRREHEAEAREKQRRRN